MSKYIVLLDQQVYGANKNVKRLSNKTLAQSDVFVEPQNVYEYLGGYTVDLSPEEALKLASHPFVQSVYQDQEVSLPDPIADSGDGQSLRAPFSLNGKPLDPGIADYIFEDGIADSGEELPWGTIAVWGGTDYSSLGNFRDNTYAFVLDTGISPNTGDLNLNSDWSRSWADDDWRDYNGHGTHVAGTIAAQANGEGIVGVAPGAEVIALKVLGDGGGGSFSWSIDAIDYAIGVIEQNNLNKEDVVLNMSLGGAFYAPVDTAVKRAADLGIRFALAAGNETQDADNVSPAAAGDHGNVYTISASDNTYNMAYFSNYDDPYGDGDDVDFAAPGVSIKSLTTDGNLVSLNGTSMASPHMAGLLLLESPFVEGPWVEGNSGGYGDYFATLEYEPEEPEEPEDGTIIFDDYRDLGAGEDSQISGEYRGFSWSSNAYVKDGYLFDYPESGFSLLADYTDDNVAYTAFANSLNAESVEGDFNLCKADFASAWEENNSYSVNAYDDGVVVGRANVIQDVAKAVIDFKDQEATGVDSISFEGRFDSIDKFEIATVNGYSLEEDASSKADLGPLGGSGWHVAFDDVVITYGDDEYPEDPEEPEDGTIIFDDYRDLGVGEDSHISGEYAGFEWSSNAYMMDGNLYEYPTSGYGLLADYADDNVAYTGWESSVNAVSVEGDFNLDQGDFASAWEDDNSYLIYAYDDGAIVGTAEVVQDVAKAVINFRDQTATGVDSISFDGRFDSIDKFEIATELGYSSEEESSSMGAVEPLWGSGAHVAFDDLVISYGDDDDDDDDDDEAPVDDDGDGFVDGIDHYQLWHEDGGIDLVTKKGKTLSDDSSKLWDATKAVQADSGFAILVENEKKDDRFRVWTADEGGMIDSQTKWKTGDEMMLDGYEDVFNEDINEDEIIGRPPIQDLDEDGFVDGIDVYQVYTGDDRELFLKNKSGKKIYSDDSSKQWDAVKCFMAEPEGTIYTLIEGARKKNGKFKVWFSEIDNGRLGGQTKWTSENKMVKEGWEEIFDYDINDNGVIGS